jgi:outer membrane protein assembly factor BamD
MQLMKWKCRQVFLCLLVFFMMLTISGCGGKNTIMSSLGFGTTTEMSADGLAMKGLDYYEHGKYHKSKETFEKLLNNFPFSEFSLLAELKVADSSFYLEEYEEAVLLYMDFEERHPANEAIPYVMYQIGMCYYNQIDSIDRDASNATNAIFAFTKLLRAHPDSPYRNEVTARIKAARNFLANHEFYVASFYERTGKHEEAMARLQYLLKEYPESVIVPTAEKLLYDIESGNPPGRSMLGWLPKKTLPDWEDLTPED